MKSLILLPDEEDAAIEKRVYERRFKDDRTECFDPEVLKALQQIVSRVGTGFQIAAVDEAIEDDGYLSREAWHAIKRLEIEHAAEISRITDAR